jgi:hypothetical protein
MVKSLGPKSESFYTEIFIFQKHSDLKTFVNVEGMLVESGNSVNVLGVEFESKLQWCRHVSNTTKNLQKLTPKKIISKFSTKRVEYVNNI